MLPKEQITEIKKQLLEQIQHFPVDKRQIAKQQIESMGSQELEEFLKKNNLIKEKSETIKEKSTTKKIDEKQIKKITEFKLPKRIP